MNDKIKEALETLSNIVAPTTDWGYFDGTIVVAFDGKEAEYLLALLKGKRNAKTQSR